MIPYIGGKSRMSTFITGHFPEDYTERTYCEVFGGAGWVLFKKEPSCIEIYNDLNADLVNLFKTIRDNYEEFRHRADFTLHSRLMFNEALEKLKEDKFLSQVEKAMHFAISRVQAFSGKGGWGYQITAKRIRGGSWDAFLRRLDVINARLKKVHIENLDFEACITKYDTDQTIFYIDPPYVNSEYYYNTGQKYFDKDDHKRLAELLRSTKGKFALSYYDDTLIRKLYKGFRFEERTVTKSSQGITRNVKPKPRDKGHELLIMNY